ncbi:uncharacterized protein [Elaeis guineensis]|uniref:Uncharacterized protein LOC105060094 isoform X2 n=1 Tax=Elaeis guineensis var. tenera TaxID=51953 RepID=A0A6I9SDM5_ELAGV|nr:uncharacterized protein LOC105060094 isoform X2 [Elaeis guineensis]
MGLGKAVKAVVAGTALLAIGAWISCASRGSTQKPTKGSKARREGGSGSAGDEDDEDQGLGARLMLLAAITGAALWALRPWMRTPSPGSGDPNNRRNNATEELEGRRVDRGGGGDRIRPNPSSLGGSNRNLVVTRIKIMSYNVWRREDMEVHERMKAIGCLVQKHSPDVIFFQSFEWWKAYEHSILPKKATLKQFCMLLSKLPVKVSCCTTFENSTLGRDLHLACIEVGMGKKLVVATSHLKRPNPPHDTHSTERVAQAKKALSFLDFFPNAVFGGDMNWDEDSDGPFPLLQGWVDAWARLRPGENGWTFDTKSNQMLKGRKLLQKRLDRFVCKLKDFKLIGVDIIGTEAIPGVFSCNDNNKKVPTLPSDHYGLLLTVSYVTINGVN